MAGGALEHLRIPTNGIELHAVVAGPRDGPLVVLLHGFPEFWYGWRRQIPALARAGYRVVAPDGRGYGLSAKPEGVAAYRLDELARDVVGVIDGFGRRAAHVVGHDWGAAVAWWLGMHHPERVERLAILNAPHPGVMRRFLARRPGQWLRSSYALFFQLPWLPEATLRAAGWHAMRAAMTGSSRPGTFSDEDLDRYQEAWSQPGALTAMLHPYRAAGRGGLGRWSGAPVTVPTLVLWGVRDRFLDPELATRSLEACRDGRLVRFEDATHWLQHEEAERVHALLREFFGTSDAAIQPTIQ